MTRYPERATDPETEERNTGHSGDWKAYRPDKNAQAEAQDAHESRFDLLCAALARRARAEKAKAQREEKDNEKEKQDGK